MPKRLETGNTRYLWGGPSRRLPCRVNDGAGFTLLELLVVLAILMIVVTAFPLALDRALPGRRVRAATAHLETAIRHAEIQSIALDQLQRLPVADLTSQFATSTHLQATGPAGAPLRKLVVYPDGSTNGGRFVVSDGSDRSSVVVSEITGRIDVNAQ